ncbi:hypothetical protein CDAR_544121 [Caerostris darwini]|uniref:Uncharacterized protein n=1 Tax=Caerostris darwini TaxID=1538125 RepID=A0AAV4THI6_9ARAC|nr:hypothetical protein CDAR_544121 [Caerostris darwini]
MPSIPNPITVSNSICDKMKMHESRTKASLHSTPKRVCLCTLQPLSEAQPLQIEFPLNPPESRRHRHFMETWHFIQTWRTCRSGGDRSGQSIIGKRKASPGVHYSRSPPHLNGLREKTHYTQNYAA